MARCAPAAATTSAELLIGNGTALALSLARRFSNRAITVQEARSLQENSLSDRELRWPERDPAHALFELAESVRQKQVK